MRLREVLYRVSPLRGYSRAIELPTCGLRKRNSDTTSARISTVKTPISNIALRKAVSPRLSISVNVAVKTKMRRGLTGTPVRVWRGRQVEGFMLRGSRHRSYSLPEEGRPGSGADPRLAGHTLTLEDRVWGRGKHPSVSMGVSAQRCKNLLAVAL